MQLAFHYLQNHCNCFAAFCSASIRSMTDWRVELTPAGAVPPLGLASWTEAGSLMECMLPLLERPEAHERRDPRRMDSGNSSAYETLVLGAGAGETSRRRPQSAGAVWAAAMAASCWSPPMLRFAGKPPLLAGPLMLRFAGKPPTLVAG